MGSLYLEFGFPAVFSVADGPTIDRIISVGYKAEFSVGVLRQTINN